METPEELLGQEPSLVELLKHHNDNKELYEDINADYLKKYQTCHSFYLGGQLNMNTMDRITKSNIDKAKVLIDKKNKEYGEPTNSYEAASIKQAAEDFENMQKTIERYYEIKMHDLYRPPNPDITDDLGGIEYQKLVKTTKIRIKN